MISCENDTYRLLNDDIDPVLYEARLFETIDSTTPSHWVWEDHRGGGGSWTPKELMKLRYVWEDYHDRIPEAVQSVNDYVSKLGPTSWERRDG